MSSRLEGMSVDPVCAVTKPRRAGESVYECIIITSRAYVHPANGRRATPRRDQITRKLPRTPRARRDRTLDVPWRPCVR